MKKLINLLVLVVILSPIAIAQNQYSYVVHFDYDKYNLRENEKVTLNDLVKKANSFSYCEMAIYAHTDYDGSAAYNLKLSANRAESVKNYMMSQGLKQHQIMIKPLGKNVPIASNDNEMGKQANRRVEIIITPYNFNSPKDILTTISDNYTQKFTIPTNDVYTIKGTKGTSIEIPCDAFVLPNGKAISNEGVTFELEEYQNFTDAIFNRLTTQSKGQIIESGGMMKLTAKFNDVELSLKPGKELTTLLPTSNLQPDMKVFVGVTNPEGFMEWEVTENNFDIEPKDKAKVPKLKLDSEILRKYMLPSVNPKNNINYSTKLEITIPILPNIGERPREPKKPEYPKVDEVVNPYLKPFTTQRYRTKKTDKEYERRLEVYKRKYERFEKKLAFHERRAIQYGIDLSSYDLGVTMLYNKFDSLLETIEKEKEMFVNAYNATRWNLTLKHFISLNDGDGIEYYNAINYLKNMSNRRIESELVNEIENIVVKEEFVKSLKLKTYPKIKALSDEGLISFDASKKVYRDMYNTRVTLSTQVITNNISGSLCESPELKNMFSNAEKIRSDKTKELGLSTPTEVNSVYRASLNNMGYVNCDRFSSVPQQLMTRVDLKKLDGEEVTLFLPEINSILRPFADNNGEYLNVPKTQRIKMVVVGLKDGVPTYEERTFNAGETKKISTNAKEVNLETMKKKLQSI